ncbi:flagellin N-methylase [mine drainage metagenome]|uniref:Flagellin N-methylase n=1 Tax=mine drainage metagenome TaxID=410659 RepID=A0A1J5RY29_9ZZZZ
MNHTPENKCASCKGATCCTYITQPISTPRTKKDFSNLLWQVAHQGVNAFRDDGTWHLLFESRCTHLQPDGRCGIYETRPHICRKHSNEYCEFDAPREEGFELHFQSYDELLEYCKKKFKNWDKPKSGEGSGKKGKKKKH